MKKEKPLSEKAYNKEVVDDVGYSVYLHKDVKESINNLIEEFKRKVIDTGLEPTNWVLELIDTLKQKHFGDLKWKKNH